MKNKGEQVLGLNNYSFPVKNTQALDSRHQTNVDS